MRASCRAPSSVVMVTSVGEMDVERISEVIGRAWLCLCELERERERVRS